MSAPVDVLAVLDRAFGAAHEHYDHLKSEAAEPALGPAYQRACRYMAEHREARAAVAELIGSLKHARSTLATALRHAAPDLFETDEDVNEHLAIKRIDAALARVQGGAA